MTKNQQSDAVHYLTKALALLELAPASGKYLDELNKVYHPAKKLLAELLPDTQGKFLATYTGLREVISCTNEVHHRHTEPW